MMRVEALLLPVLLVAPACAPSYPRHEATERFKLPPEGAEAGAAATRVEVRVDRGNIDIRAGEPKEAGITVRKQAFVPGDDEAKALFEAMRIETERRGDSLLVDVRLPRAEWGGRLRADIEMVVPRDLSLKLASGDGDIAIQGFQGNVEAETRDGRIQLEELRGKIRAWTGDGRVEGKALDGNVDVTTEDGNIDLTGRFTVLSAVTGDGAVEIRCERAAPLEGDWLVSSSDGSITFIVPEGLAARLEASTGDGRILVHLSLNDSRATRRRLVAFLGERPEHTIALKTFDGNIALRSE